MDERKTLTVPEAGRAYFDLGRHGSYEAAKRGDIPTIRIGRKLRVPVVALERKLEGCAMTRRKMKPAMRLADLARRINARLAKIKQERPTSGVRLIPGVLLHRAKKIVGSDEWPAVWLKANCDRDENEVGIYAMNTITIATSSGDVVIREDELPTIETDELETLEISRDELYRVFAEGVKLTQGVKPRDRIRPVACEQRDGSWFCFSLSILSRD